MSERKPHERDSALADWWKRPESVASEGDLPVSAEARTPPAPGSSQMRGIVCVFSETRKEGPWQVPQYLRVLAVFGNAKIDLREAVLQYHETVIEAKAVLAEIQIIVPPDIIVECDGEALLGSFTLSEGKRRGGRTVVRPPNAPVVRVIGSAHLASVTVKVRPLK
jgi:hypothetical protein